MFGIRRRGRWKAALIWGNADCAFVVASRIARLAEQGQIKGQSGDPMIFQPLNPEAEIEIDDEIVTSSYSNGIFPSGIPIGRVEDVGRETTLLTRDVFVRPYVDFTRLDFVMVVLRAPLEEVPAFEVDPDTPFTSPVLPSPSPEPSPSPRPSPRPDASPGPDVTPDTHDAPSPRPTP